MFTREGAEKIDSDVGDEFLSNRQYRINKLAGQMQR